MVSLHVVTLIHLFFSIDSIKIADFFYPSSISKRIKMNLSRNFLILFI